MQPEIVEISTKLLCRVTRSIRTHGLGERVSYQAFLVKPGGIGGRDIEICIPRREYISKMSILWMNVAAPTISCYFVVVFAQAAASNGQEEKDCIRVSIRGNFSRCFSARFAGHIRGIFG